MSVSNINYIQISNCVVNECHIRENTSNIDLTPNFKIWQLDTFLLAKFLGNLESGNISLGGLTITGWKVRKRRIDSISITELATLELGDTEDFQYTDTAVRPNITYEWQVSPMSSDIEGQPITIQQTVNFDYWWLSDATGTTNESYPFFAGIDSSLQVSDIVINKQRFVYENTFNSYPVVSYGNQQYISGTITAALLDAFCEISVNYRKLVVDFINNGKPKYLKNNLGDIWLVDTHSSSYKLYTELQEPVSSITFNFMEIGKVDENV